MEYFIEKIEINKVRHLNNVSINLSSTKRKHLILTGKNGSGKTSVINTIRNYLSSIHTGNFEHIANWKNSINLVIKEVQSLENLDPSSRSDTDNQRIISLKNNLRSIKSAYEPFSYLSLEFNSNNSSDITEFFKSGKFILAYFDSKRNSKVNIPNGISKISKPQFWNIEDTYPSQVFLQYIVNLRAQRSFARDENDNKTVSEIDTWFLNFEKSLREVFEDESLTLKFDFQNFNFIINSVNREPFDFSSLSDGFSSFLNIFTDLIIRTQTNDSFINSYDVQGIVLIDEIETHLHVSLQKKILSFLTTFFPKIQFILTTHSPFVVNSINNAVVYDLENKVMMEDASAYSYDSLVENYFEVTKYSQEISRKIRRYESLVNKEKNKLTDDQLDELIELRLYLDDIPEFLAPELKMIFDRIEWQRKGEVL